MAAWNNQKLVVYHGSDSAAFGATNSTVNLALCRPCTDFGQGFYTTTNLHQAKQWANERVRRKSHVPGSILKPACVYSFNLDRDWLAGLDTLTFVRATTDFWSFVGACRSGAIDHRRHVGPSRPTAGGNTGQSPKIYEAVYGLVTLWPQRLILSDCDQISFHTQAVLAHLSPRLHVAAKSGLLF